MNNSKQIYIADDELNIRVLIKGFLEKAGHRVTDFENGDLLFEAFSESPADLVVLDVMMPGSSGFVICKELRKKSTVPIIMLTARDSDLDYSTGLALGSDDYLVKPFSPVALVKRIESIFRRIEIERGQFNTEQPDSKYTGRTLLVAKDVDVNRNTLVSILKLMGLEVECAEDGFQAMQMFRDAPERYDMSLMDL